MAIVAKRLLYSSHGVFQRSQNTSVRNIFRHYTSRASSSPESSFTSSFSSFGGDAASAPSSILQPFLLLPEGFEFDKSAWKIKPTAKNKVKDKDDGQYCNFLNLKEDQGISKIRKAALMMWGGQDYKSRCVGSSKGWLAYMNRNTCDFFLFNPFNITSTLPFIQLSPIETLPTVLSKLVRKNPEKQSPHSTLAEFECFQEASPVSGEEFSKFFIKKVALSNPPSPSEHRNSRQIHDFNSTVMIIHGHKHSRRLAFCRLGDSSWTALQGPRVSYQDIVYFSEDQKFYALHCSTQIDAWDLSCPSSPKMTGIQVAPPSRRFQATEAANEQRYKLPRRSYLVECYGELLMVVRNFNSYITVLPEENSYKLTKSFDVFKLDFDRKEWVHMPRLDGYSLFVGLNEAVSVDAADCPGLKEDSIYFTCMDVETEPDTCGAYDMGFYSLKNKEIQSLYRNIASPIQPSPIWIFH